MSNIKTYLLEGWTSYVLIGIGLSLLLVLTAIVSRWWVESQATDLTRSFVLVAKDTPDCSFVADEKKATFVNAQRTTAVTHGNNHRETAIKFYTYFYGTYVILSIFGLLSLITLAIITKSGVAQASNHVIAVFLVSSGLVVMYQGFFGVFQQQKNSENNAKIAVAYANLVDRIDTYCATGKVNVKDASLAFTETLVKPAPTPVVTTTQVAAKPTNTKAKPAEPAPPKAAKVSPFFVSPDADEFINYVNWQLEQNRQIAIALDTEKIAMADRSTVVLPAGVQ